MPNSPSPQSRLEDLLDEVDREWSEAGSCNLKGLVDRLASPCMEDVLELCVADYEWQWRTKKVASTIPAGQSPSESSIPNIQKYQSLLGSGWREPACQRVLLETEWLARSAWGDKPRIDVFLEEFPTLTGEPWSDDTRRQLIEGLNLSVQLEMRTQTKDRELITAAIPASLIVGRQKVGEPPSPHWDESQCRLVAWPIENVQVSREQLRIHRVRAMEMRITNLSDGRAIQANGFDLLPRQSGHFGIPIQLQAAGTTITILPADTSFPRTKHR